MWLFNKLFCKVEDNQQTTNEIEETIVKLAGIFDRRNYSSLNIQPISEQKEQIKSIYGDVLCYSMNENDKIEFNPNHAVFNGYVKAFKEHRPITISPDIFWLLIIQSFANHVNNNSERLRPMFVNFDGKQELTVKRENMTPESATLDDWNEIFNEFAIKISDFTGLEIKETLEPNFSTTTPITKAVGQLSIMNAMKEYFDYHVIMCVCAFPFIVVQGTVNDWQYIISKLENLRKFKLEDWVDKLIPIIQKIIDTKKGNIDTEFWNNMIHIVPENGIYEPGYIDGWFINFFLYTIYGDEVGNRIYDESDDLSSEMLTVPFKLTVAENNYDCEFVAGFVGISQVEKDKSIMPQIHWLVRLEDKEKKSREKMEIELKKRQAKMNHDVIIKHSKH